MFSLLVACTSCMHKLYVLTIVVFTSCGLFLYVLFLYSSFMF